MPAGLAKKANGEAALWLNGQPAWHKMGKVWDRLKEAPPTLEKLLEWAGLDFEVEKRPTFFGATTESKMGTELVTQGQNWATVRTDTGQQLGTVGDVYEPFQNRQAFAILDDLTTQGGFNVESAGLLANGARVFVSVRMGEDLILDPEGAADAVRRYLFLTTAHDGNGQVTGGATPTRIVCTNTLNMAISNASLTWNIRHTKGGIDSLKEAARTVVNAQTYYDQFEKVGTQLLHTKMTRAQFHKFVTEIAMPLKDDAPAFVVARVEKLRAKAIHLFEEAETQENIRNTRWGALNALTEQIEHFGEGRVPKSLLLDAATPKTLAQDIAKGARVIKGLDVEKKSTLAKQLLTWKR